MAIHVNITLYGPSTETFRGSCLTVLVGVSATTGLRGLRGLYTRKYRVN